MGTEPRPVKEKHYELWAIAALFGAILVALLRQCWSAPEKERSVAVSSRAPQSGAEGLPGWMEGADPESPQGTYRYILHVIEHGSDQLGFPGGVMEGGYLPADEAPRVACYVMELGGHKCPHDYPKDAAMYFTSVCGGCHGDDGKGLHGAYPDLTRPRLLGIEKMMKERKR